jgi:nitroreductase
MNNNCKTDHKITDLLEKRFSPKFFKNKEIKKEKLLSILEAFRWTPSCYNEQPFRLIVGDKFKSREIYDKIFNSLVDLNKEWAITAPILFVSIYKKNFSRNNKLNNYAFYDLGQSISHLTFQAMSENIFVHQMAGFSKKILKNSFNISEEFEIATVIACGYLEEIKNLTATQISILNQTIRERKKLDELIINKEILK